jgi:hypothetical protein
VKLTTCLHLVTWSRMMELPPPPICLHSINLNQLSRRTNLPFFTFNVWPVHVSGMESPKERPSLSTPTLTKSYRYRGTVLYAHETKQNTDAEQRILFKMKKKTHTAEVQNGRAFYRFEKFRNDFDAIDRRINNSGSMTEPRGHLHKVSRLPPGS